MHRAREIKKLEIKIGEINKSDVFLNKPNNSPDFETWINKLFILIITGIDVYRIKEHTSEVRLTNFVGLIFHFIGHRIKYHILILLSQFLSWISCSKKMNFHPNFIFRPYFQSNWKNINHLTIINFDILLYIYANISCRNSNCSRPYNICHIYLKTLD